MLQNIIVRKLIEANNNYISLDEYFIHDMYDFYRNSNGNSVPMYLYIDPFTFHECFYTDHPDIMFSGDDYWYKGSTQIKFDPRFFGFFNTMPY